MVADPGEGFERRDLFAARELQYVHLLVEQ
jgi:hypothetical protein